MANVREWTVLLSANTEHEYVVSARTPESAESEAEALYESGDMGAPSGEPEIISSIAVCAETSAESEFNEDAYYQLDADGE